MTALRFGFACVGFVFAAMIIWAIYTGDFWAAGSWLTTDPWGIVTLADLYFGFALTALVIALYERSWQALLWVLPIPFLGNVWVVIWFVYRLPDLARRLDRRDDHTASPKMN